jgi:hypothetical protein
MVFTLIGRAAPSAASRAMAARLRPGCIVRDGRQGALWKTFRRVNDSLSAGTVNEQLPTGDVAGMAAAAVALTPK